jgi:preprotein translocase SecE subunit
MDKQTQSTQAMTQRWVNISFILVSILVAYLFFVTGAKVIASTDLEAKVKDIDTWIKFTSIGLGIIVYFVLSKSDRINQYMHEVVVELARVTWPTKSETVNSTIITLIMVIISGVVLGLIDKFWTIFIQLFI